MKYSEKENVVEFAFKGRESSGVPDVLGEIVPDVGTRNWNIPETEVALNILCSVIQQRTSGYVAAWLPHSLQTLGQSPNDCISIYTAHPF